MISIINENDSFKTFFSLIRRIDSSLKQVHFIACTRSSRRDTARKKVFRQRWKYSTVAAPRHRVIRMVIFSRSFRPNFLPYKLIIISDYKHNQFTQTRLYSCKKDPRFVTGFLEADGHLILFISYTSPNKLQDGLVIVIYFNRAIPIRANILILRSTIVVLPNANWCSAPQLQNSISVSRNYSTLATQKCSEENFKLNPWWLSGFVDGEGCFHVSITPRNNRKLGWEVKPSFHIRLHRKDQPVLDKICKLLKVGCIYEKGPSAVEFNVKSFQDLESVINHFDKYPLLTKKRADFDLLKKVLILMKRKEHLTPEGLRKIVAIRASMNLGLSEKLYLAFPDVVQVERPLVELPKTINPEWIAGFTSAEGCFYLRVSPSRTYSVGYRVELIFQLTQHSRDSGLMKNFKIYLGSGTVRERKKSLAVDYRVEKISENIEKIIPFFQKYPIPQFTS